MNFRLFPIYWRLFPLSLSITPSLLNSRLKTNRFHKSFPPWTLFLPQDWLYRLLTGPFLLSIFVFVFFSVSLPYFFCFLVFSSMRQFNASMSWVNGSNGSLLDGSHGSWVSAHWPMTHVDIFAYTVKLASRYQKSKNASLIESETHYWGTGTYP